MSAFKRSFTFAILTALLGIAGCGGGSNSDPPATNPPPTNQPPRSSNWDSLVWDTDTWT